MASYEGKMKADRLLPPSQVTYLANNIILWRTGRSPDLATDIANGRYLNTRACLNFRIMTAPLSLSALVVHLFEAVVALIVAPIDEDRSVIDARAILAPTFKSYMSLRQGGYGRSLP